MCSFVNSVLIRKQILENNGKWLVLMREVNKISSSTSLSVHISCSIMIGTSFQENERESNQRIETSSSVALKANQTSIEC